MLHHILSTKFIFTENSHNKCTRSQSNNNLYYPTGIFPKVKEHLNTDQRNYGIPYQIILKLKSKI